jgi:hypothetical protein
MSLGLDLAPSSNVPGTWMQNLPGQPAKAMGNDPDRLVVTEPRQETPIPYLKFAAVGL